jgi:hypothetical protein
LAQKRRFFHFSTTPKIDKKYGHLGLFCGFLADLGLFLPKNERLPVHKFLF